MFKRIIHKIQCFSPLRIILCFFLLVEIIYLIRFNFAHGSYSLDYDVAKLMTHMAEIVKTGHILIPGWRYMTTHEIDSAMLLAIPVYALTRNLFFSFAVSNTIYIVVIVLVVMRISRNCDIKAEYGLLSCCVILIPYQYGMLSYVNMMFFRGAQYSIKALLPLLTILILSFPKKDRLRDSLLLLFWGILLFLSSFSSGLFPFITGLLPIFAVYLLRVILGVEKAGFLAGKLRTIICGVVLCAAGVLLHQYYDISSSGLDATLVKSFDFTNQISENISNYFDLLNSLPQTDVSVASFDGIGYLLRFGLALVLLLSVIVAVRTLIKASRINKGEGELFTVFEYLLSVILVNIIIHLLSSYNSARYYIVEVICMMVLAGLLFGHLADSVQVNKLFFLHFLICMLLAITWILSRNVMRFSMDKHNTFGYTQELCTIFEEQNTDNVIFVDQSELEEICRVLSPNRQFSNYSTKSESFISYDWYIATDEPSYYGKTALIVTDEEIASVAKVFGDYEANKYEYIGCVENLNIYRTDDFVFPHR